MPTYQVIDKATREEVTRYCAAAITEQINGTLYPLASYDHAEFDDTVTVSSRGPRRLTKLQFIDRLGDAAYVTILQLARSEVTVEAFVKRFEMATPDQDGTSIDLDDPRTAAGVTAIGAALEAMAVVAPGWAQEVLNG